MGRLERKHGYTIDNLLSVDLVNADGDLRHVSDEDDPELFWGLRGAGANFGIATAFEFRLHPIGPNVTTAVVVFAIERAREAAALYRDLSRSAPDHMHLGLSFANAPGGRATTPGQRGDATVAVGATHVGDQRDAERDLRPLRGQIAPLLETVTATTYLAVQKMSDEEMAWGKRFYMKGAFLDELSDTSVDRMAEHVSIAPGECSIGLWAQGGATADVAEDAMAFTGRGAAHWLGAEAFWVDKERDLDYIAWARAAMAALKPFTRAGQYVNDVVEQGDDVVRGIYGNKKYDRLRALKRTHDPDNVFRLNQNIRPCRDVPVLTGRTLPTGTANSVCRAKGRKTKWQTTARPSSSSYVRWRRTTSKPRSDCSPTTSSRNTRSPASASAEKTIGARSSRTTRVEHREKRAPRTPIPSLM